MTLPPAGRYRCISPLTSEDAVALVGVADIELVLHPLTAESDLVFACTQVTSSFESAVLSLKWATEFVPPPMVNLPSDSCKPFLTCWKTFTPRVAALISFAAYPRLFTRRRTEMVRGVNHVGRNGVSIAEREVLHPLNISRLRRYQDVVGEEVRGELVTVNQIAAKQVVLRADRPIYAGYKLVVCELAGDSVRDEPATVWIHCPPGACPVADTFARPALAQSTWELQSICFPSTVCQ